MRLRFYSHKELRVILWIMLPYTVAMNSIVFGECIYLSLREFAVASVFSGVYFFTGYVLFDKVAVLTQKRFPANHDLLRRISILLPILYAMNVLILTGYYGYLNLFNLLNCAPRTGSFVWMIVFGLLATTIITFLNEAIVNWDKWKASVTETERLKNSYQKTKLLGLKGQINPHFLFNCFNSLSSLINDNERGAEQFLDEMTKVHRYMLRGDDEQLVTLGQELKFAQSYLYLTGIRFGDAIRSVIEISEDAEKKYVPPLCLQIILENIIYTNTASKSNPLRLTIRDNDNSLVITNSVQTRIQNNAIAVDEGLDNLITQYRLLHVTNVAVHENPSERTIVLPLLTKEEVSI